MKAPQYQPKTGAKCACRRGVQRDNCPACEGTGWVIDFRAIRDEQKRRAGFDLLASINPIPAPSMTQGLIDRIEAGETAITQQVGPRHVAKQIAAGLRRWWETDRAPDGADSEAVTDYGRTEVQGWSAATPDAQTVDWRVILLTVD